MTQKPKVVVLGAGFAGVAAAQGLHEVADVSLIDKKDFIEVTWANVRVATVESSLAEKSTIPYSELPKLPLLVQSAVTAVTSNAVSLANGTRLPFDYLVLATGSTYGGGVFHPAVTSRTARITDLEDQESKLRAAHSVLVVGGGPVGVEVAGEIVTDLPDKKVTLVHSRDILIDGKDVKQHKAICSFLQKKGAEVILGEKVSEISPGTYRLTPSGKTIDADLVYWAVGSRPNTDFLKTSSLADALDAHGYVKVNEFFQVEGHSNIFALGDIMARDTAKLGYLAGQHGAAAAKIIAATIKSGDKAKLTAWKPNGGADAMLISLGRSAGAGHFGSVHPWSFVVTNIKSKTLFLPKTRKDLGLKA